MNCERLELFKILDPKFKFEEIKEFKSLVASSNFLWKGENNEN